ncbi:uncharacterized protein LOC102491160 isoform X2 [Tupaia chinensis]|uniref:uncharacterized protein LOC102491160 isoform X2 n=1 Tax=Tupaia chinensis TaxID=246437 RepID=UPI000FFBBEB1|nr:uncharacterized protein LOC102491160 isoform X2 [Tupaia chinensis]
MGNLNCCSRGFRLKDTRRVFPLGSENSAAHHEQQARKISIWKNNRVYPVDEPIEAPVEDITEELSCEDFLEEEIPSSVKVDLEAIRNRTCSRVTYTLTRTPTDEKVPPEDLPQEFPRDGENEETTSNASVASLVNEDDWIMESICGSSCEDKDSPDYFADVEDSERGSNNPHLSTKSLVLRSRDSTEDIKGDEEQEGEMKTNTTGESTEVAAPVPDHTNEDEETEETPTNFVTDIWEGISPWTSEFLEFSKYWET